MASPSNHYGSSRQLKTNENIWVNKSASIINIKDFIKLKTNICADRYEMDKKERDDNLRRLSLEKVKKWPDSIEQVKKKELEMRKQRFFNEEGERRRLDEEEAKYQKIKKQIILDNAKKRLFESQDVVKSFHSSLIISDVLKGREYQLEITKKKADLKKDLDRQWEEKEIEKMKAYDEREKQKLVDADHKRKEQMVYVNKQFRDYKLKRIRDYQDGVVEGNIIQSEAKKAIQEEKDREIQKRKDAIQRQEETKRENAELEKLKEFKKQKEKEEEKKIEEHAIKKQQIADLKKRMEIQKFNDKQKTRQMMIDKQIEHLSNLKNKEDEILEKQKEETEEKYNRELALKKQRLDTFKKQIEENRLQQIERKKNLQVAEQEQDKIFIKYWQEKIKDLEEDERKEKEDVRKRRVNLKDYHLIQMENKREIAEKDFIESQEEAMITNQKLKEADMEFINYAENLLKEYYKEGKDITPIILELKNYKKKQFYGN